METRWQGKEQDIKLQTSFNKKKKKKVILNKLGEKMPKALELKLRKEAKKKFGTLKSPRARAYVYGTMRKLGWKPKRKK